MIKRIFTITVCGMLLASLQATAAMDAFGRKVRKPTDIFVGVAVLSNTVGGSFDGKTILINSAGTEYLLAPEIERATGQSIGVGVRAYDVVFIGQNDLEIQLGYSWASHKGKWQGAGYDIRSQEISADFIPHFRPGKTVQPFFDVGIFESGITVNKGSGDGSVTGDANFTGFGLNAGGGITLFLSKDVAISGGLIYRLTPIYMAEGVKGERRSVRNFSSADTSTNISLKVYF